MTSDLFQRDARELPETWAWMPFDFALQSVSDEGKKLKTSEYLTSGPIPVIDQGASVWGGFTNRSELVYTGHLPVILFGDHTRRFKYVDCRFVIGAEGIKILKPSNMLDPKYAFYALQNSVFPDKGYSRHFQYLRKIDLPLAPLPEQRRIVAKLEELFSELDAGVTALRRAQRRLTRYRQSLLHAAVTGELTREWRKQQTGDFKIGTHEELPPGWDLRSLNDVGRWGTGGTPSRTKPEFFGTGVPWIKSGDLPDGKICNTDEQITVLGLENSSAKRLPIGTISMALYGATIGKLGILTFEAATNQACANVIPNSALVDTDYLFYFLLSQRAEFIKQGQGGAQPNISQGIVRSHPIPVPPIPEQRAILAELDRRLSAVEVMESTIQASLRRAERLRQSILERAFRGELVSQDPSDEPATALLAKMQTKAEPPAPARRGRPRKPATLATGDRA